MKSIRVWLPLALLGALPALRAQTLVDLRTQAKSVDFSSAASTKPSKTGTILPSTCSVGATFFNTAALAGHNLYGCTATNTWSLLGANLWFGGGNFNSGDCAAFDSSGNIVSAGPCISTTAVTMSSPFATAGSLMVSGGPGRQGVASSCSDNGGMLTCPGGFSGHVVWTAGSGTNNRQILGPTGAFTSNFNYRWSDSIPTAATLMKIGTPGSGESSLGPAIPDTDYVTPSGAGTLQNKTFDGTSIFSSYVPWTQISKPAAPAAGYLRVYARVGSGLCWLNSSGTETCAGAGIGDPGGTGVVVETSPGVTTNRTIVAGSANISVTNGTGAAGNPTVDIASTVDFSGKTTSPVQVGPIAGMPITCSVGQAFFNSSSVAGQNLYFCTATNEWTQMAGAISSIFGRTGAVTAQTGDYTYSQISNTPSALPPSGTASGDLSGSYPNPIVSQLNGAAIPAGGLLKANSGRQIVTAVAGTDYAPATGATSILKGNGTGGFSGASFSDVVNLFAGCTGTQYLGADGGCHTASSGGGSGSGSVVLTTGAGAPATSCAAPSSSNLAVYVDTTNGDEWWCYATNSWKKTLSVTGSGPYQVSGAVGSAPATPAAGMVTCYFDSTLAQTCLDSSGNVWQMVNATTLAAMRMHSCDLAFGSAKAGTAALADADLGPQTAVCFIPGAATVVEVDVRANGGTPSIIMGVDHGGAVSNVLSSPLGTAANGGRACSKTTAVSGIDGTVCVATLQNTPLYAGDYIQAVSGTAGGVATWMTVHVVYALN